MTKFKRIRTAAGLSQTQTAKLLNKPVTTVARWDRGDIKCNDLTLIAFETLIKGEIKKF